MTCPHCGCFAPPDPDTGYDGDDLCPSCQHEGWTTDASGEIVNEQDAGEAQARELVDRR